MHSARIGCLGKVIGHPNLTLIREDFRHVEVLTRAMSGVGSVVHLGGLVGDPACAVDPELTVDINVTATKLVGEIAKAQGVKRLVFSPPARARCTARAKRSWMKPRTSTRSRCTPAARSRPRSCSGALNDPEFRRHLLAVRHDLRLLRRERFDLVVNLLCVVRSVRERHHGIWGRTNGVRSFTSTMSREQSWRRCRRRSASSRARLSMSGAMRRTTRWARLQSSSIDKCRMHVIVDR